MSTLKADAITSATSGADLGLSGDAGGVVDIEAGFKVGGSVGVPTASIQDDAVTLAKMAAGTDGNLISFDASGNPVAVATGNDGQVLTSTGAGSPPAFEDAAGGGAWTVVGTTSASSSSSLVVTGIDATYKTFVVIGEKLKPASTAKAELQIGTGAGLKTSGYSWGTLNDPIANTATTSGSVVYSAASNDSMIQIGCGTETIKTDSFISFVGYLSGAYDNFKPTFHGTAFYTTNGNESAPTLWGGRYNSTAWVTQISFEFSTGNITSGDLTVWGIKYA